MNEKLDNINLTEEEKGVIEQRLKSKKRKQRTAKFLLSIFTLTSLTSCSGATPFAGLIPDWFKAMTNQDTKDGEDEGCGSIGARFSYSSDNDTLSFNDVFEENVKSMDAHSYIYDYFELIEIVKEVKSKWGFYNLKEVAYTDLGLTEDDFLYHDGVSLEINEEGGEKLKNNPKIINLWYYNSTDKYQPSYYLPYIIVAKEDWKNEIRPEMYSWFISKVKEEQDAILLTNNTKWALKNGSEEGIRLNEDIENIDLATSKGYIPYKLGISFLSNCIYEQEKNSFYFGIKKGESLTKEKKEIGGIQYMFYGSKNGYGNSSLAFNNSVLESKYIEFPTSYLLEDNMQYDDYRSIMLTTKKNIAINSISYDVEFYNVANEDYVSTLTNDTQSIFGMEVGEFRLEQLDTYRNYTKRYCGALIGPWLATQNAFNCGNCEFDTNYIFEEEGQTKYWNYCTDEEKEGYYFKENITYHVEIEGVPKSLVGVESAWTRERVNEFRLVIPAGCNLNLKVELNGKNAYSFYKIKNLKIDYDVVNSWTYISKNTLAGIGYNYNYIYTHY